MTRTTLSCHKHGFYCFTCSTISYYLVTTVLLLLVSAGKGKRVECDVINERQRYYLGTEALEIYQLANNLKEVFLFPSANATRLGGIVWHARHLNLTRDAMRLSTLLYRRLYNKIIVNMTDERSDGLQFKCSVKNHGDLASGWATTRLGESPTVHLINNTKSRLQIIEGANLTLCFTLRGTPTPRVSLLYTTSDGNQTTMERSRYTVQGNCLHFGPVRQPDTGHLSVQAVNCFNTSMFSLHLEVLTSETPKNASKPSTNTSQNPEINTFGIFPQTKPVEIVRATQQASKIEIGGSEGITVPFWVVAAVGGACALLVGIILIALCCKLKKRGIGNGSKDEPDSKYKVQVCEGIYSTPCNTIPAKQNKPSSLEMTEKTSPSPSTTPSSPFEFNSAYDSLTPREKRGNSSKDKPDSKHKPEVHDATSPSCTTPFIPFEFNSPYDTLTPREEKDSSSKRFFPVDEPTEKKDTGHKEPFYSEVPFIDKEED